MSRALPDPLEFTLATLAQRGALVEQAPGAAMALLPTDEARRLGLPEELRLTTISDDVGGVGCGLGSPLLERLLGEVRAGVALASVRLEGSAPRPAQALAAAGRFVLRNGVADVVEVTAGSDVYLAATIAYVAEADDRFDGTISVVVNSAGGTPDEIFAERLYSDATRASPPAAVTGDPLGAAKWTARRATPAALARLTPKIEGVTRRHQREHARILEYFAALITEARAPRRTVAAEAVAAKVAHLVAERDAKLRDLVARFSLRVRLAPAALICATVAVARIQLRLRRRKGERDLTVLLPAGARAVDEVACEGCPRTTARPLLCDDELHLLCETCVPVAAGRPRCPACRRPAGGLRPTIG